MPGISFADQVILRPVGQGACTDWSPVNAATEILAVDDGDPHNGDTDYITGGGNNSRSTFFVPNAGVPEGSTINWVESRITHKRDGSQNSSGAFVMTNGLCSGGTVFETGSYTAGSSYVESTNQYTTDPVTGSAWTDDVVNNWTEGGANIRAFGPKRTSGPRELRVTQVEVVVDYTPPDLTTVFSGTLYSDEGSTPITSPKTIKMALGTTTTSIHSTSTDSNGNWSITIEDGANLDAVTEVQVWVDGDSIKASLYTRGIVAGQANPNLDLYQDRVIISREDGGTVLPSELGFYDGDDDNDIQYTRNGSLLSVRAGNELHMNEGVYLFGSDEVILNGNAGGWTDGSLHLTVGSRWLMSGTTTLAGNFISSTTLSSTAQKLIFNATTTGRVIVATSTALPSVTFNGSGGEWTFVGDATTSTTTITAGTVVAPTNLTILGTFTNSGTFTAPSGILYVRDGNFVNNGLYTHNNGTVVIDRTIPDSSSTVSGSLVGSSALNHFDARGDINSGVIFADNASTTDVTVTTVNLSTPTHLTVSGNFINNGKFTTDSDTMHFNGGSAQSISGQLTGTTNDFNNVIFSGAGTKTFSANASTTGDFTINSGATVVAPSKLSVTGNYTNNGDFTDSSGTVYFDGGSAQAIAEQMTGTADDFYNLVFSGAGTKTFSANASTTGDFTISSGATVVAPAHLTLAGDYTNNGSFNANSGTTTFNGAALQTADGNLSSSNAFYNVDIRNNSATTTFNATTTVDNHFRAVLPNTKLAFPSNATTTLSTVTVTGTSGNEIKLRSTTDGSQHTIHVTGAYTFDYVDVKDSYACPSGTLTANNSTSTGNNTCWSFPGPVQLLLTGVLYSDEGSTAITSGKPVTIAVGTSTLSLHSDTTDGSGAFSVDLGESHSLATSTPIVVFLNGAAEKAAHFTKASSSLNNMPNLDLYQNRVIISHEGTSGTSTTNTDLSFYDGDDDSDIQYAANAGVLSVRAGNELHIKENKTFAPGGEVIINGNAGSGTDGSFHLANSATYTASATTTVAGNFTASSSAQWLHNFYPTVFIATTTGKVISATSSELGNLIFNGVGGAWSFTRDSATTSDIAITNGTFTSPTNRLTVNGSFTNNGAFNHNSGALYLVGGTETLSGTLTDASALNDVVARQSWTGTTSDPSSSTDQGQAVAIDENNIYVTGYCNGCGNKGSWSWHTTAFNKYDGSLIWATSTDISTGADNAFGITVDNRNVYVAGYCGSGCASVGGSSFYIIAHDKYDGSFIWATSTDLSASSDLAYGITHDSYNIYVTGYCDGCGNNASWSLRTIAYNKADASFVWSTTTDPTSGFDSGRAITVDESNVYVTGICDDGCGLLGNEAIYTIAYNKADASFVWATTTDPSSNFDYGFGVVVDENNVYVTGRCSGCLQSGYTIAYNKADASFVWATTTNPGNIDYANDIAQDVQNVYVTGTCDGCGSLGSYAYYTIAYNKTDASFVWATTTDATSTEEVADGIAVDNSHVYVTGRCNGCGQLGGMSYRTLSYNKLDGSSGRRYTFSSNASTTDITVQSGATLVAPASGVLSISGDYTNNGSFDANSGTTTFSGTGLQTADGNLSSASAFYNVDIRNNSATTTFNATTTVDNHFRAVLPDTRIAFPSNATTTLNTVNISGTEGNEVSIRSTTAGQAHTLDVNGAYSFLYVDLKDSYACSNGTLTATSSVDSTGNTCWTFIEPPVSTIVSDSAQHFYVGQATTTLGTVTVTDHPTIPEITTTNNIRITIPTTTTDFRFDTNASPSFGGTASGKVSTVTYEDSNATMVIAVTTNFAGGDTLSVNNIEVGNFATISTSAGNLELHTDGSSAGTPAAVDSADINITGSLTLQNHTLGQVDDAFSFQNVDDEPLFAFQLSANGEDALITDLVVSLSGIDRLTTSDLADLRLYRDVNSDGALDGGDALIESGGIFTINGQDGAITFSSDWTATSSQSADYLVTGDTVSIPNGALAVFDLLPSDITATGGTSSYTTFMLGNVSRIQHNRNNAGAGGGGGSSGNIGGDPPPGDGVQGGGGSGGGGGAGEGEDGENIASDPDFYKPTSTGAPDNEWTNPTNAYDSDGVYATAGTNSFKQTYYGFGVSVPGSNTIQGIEVKIDASGSTAAGTLSIALSWDGGTSYTTAKATPTVSDSDIVYEVGEPSDTWGRSWSPTEFSASNFRIRITANTSSNTLNLDALEVRVYHQAGGGGSGGGGGI